MSAPPREAHKGKTSTYEAELRLQSVHDLFRTPLISPMSEDYHPYSNIPGVEFIAKEFMGRRGVRSIDLTLFLPASEIEPDLEMRVRAGISRYCDSRIKDIDEDLAVLRTQVRQTLLIAVAAWFVLIGLAQVLSRVDQAVFDILGQGLGVAAWVLLWFPLDAIIFGIRHRQADRTVYRRVAETKVRILPLD
jgi:hypothetical protein